MAGAKREGGKMTRRVIIVFVAAAAGFSAGFLVHFLRAGKEAAWAPRPVATERMRHGKQMALSVCGSCHLLPEPALLTKTQWAHQILPEMAQWLGIEPVDLEAMRDGKILREAKLYPEAPIISTDDWLAVWDYYVSTAPERPVPTKAKPRVEGDIQIFRARKLNFHGGIPAISLLKIDPSERRLYVGDTVAQLLATVDASGTVLTRVRVPSAPVSLDANEHGASVTLIGQFFPSDAAEGAVVFLSQDQPTATPETLLDQLRRPTDAKMADLNGDRRLDLVVCSYGNRLGRFSWFESKPQGQFEEHVLLDRPGALRAEVRDFDRDGRPDILVMTAQAREGLSLFFNEGNGRFRAQTVVEQHPLFGYASFEIVDFNGDGHWDILTANGDNGDHAAPHKNYHGVRLLLNDGKSRFREAWFYPMEGAYKAQAADFDQDGDLDVAAIAFYPDFAAPVVESFVYLENKGGLNFVPRSLSEHELGRWMVMDAGDLDGDGDIDLALGSFLAGPTTIPVPARVREQWRNEGAMVLVLENVRR